MKMMCEWIKRGHNCSSFFQEKGKAQRGSNNVHTSHKVGHKKRFTIKLFNSSKLLPKIISKACITKSTRPKARILGVITQGSQKSLHAKNWQQYQTSAMLITRDYIRQLISNNEMQKIHIVSMQLHFSSL